MLEQARHTLQKCDGLPLAISTIGGFLATMPKTDIEWKKMNDNISTELVINPELRGIKTILMRSYDGLPYHLKAAFLYLSIFPDDHKIRWGRLVRRWIAEGYSRDMHGMTAIELCQRYFDELMDRSMILPGDGIDQYNRKNNSCQLHDMIREICISKAREENLVFTLEEGCCLSDTQGAIHNLVIGSNCKRDKDVLESMLDLSHVRSLTVFGQWRSFFISDSMRFLRVLDLEDTLELRNCHLDKIGQLRHLKYLSVRGCSRISCLPNSLGNLSHLETLDVRGTRLNELPKTFTNLQQLQHLRGDSLFFMPQVLDVCLNRHDLFNLYRFSGGIAKLKGLYTLGNVFVSCGNGKATVKKIGDLSQLRKLKVQGINELDSCELWSAIAGHSQLLSLSVERQSSGVLDGCLCEGLSPPISLESLTLDGELTKATEWIGKLQNLSKLVLEHSELKQDDDAIQALGFLPNLAVLRLNTCSFEGTKLHFQSSSFLNLMVLELYVLGVNSIKLPFLLLGFQKTTTNLFVTNNYQNQR
uniref:Uncharacterized protein n=2 Tax=Aegilops tauschii TaxID=37682 RepID=A0A453MSU8_AEGTS